MLMMTAALFSGSSFSQDKQDWKFMHPTPQSNLLRKVKMVDENNWVTVGANGTFMHTTNSGANWYFHFFAGKSTAALQTTNSYDAWFFDSNTGIVVGDQGYIGRTTDGGVNFDTTGSGLVPTNSRHWSIWFADANTGFIGSGSQNAFTTRILKTTNGGLNWSVAYIDNSGSTSYLISLGGIDAQNVFGVWANGTLVRSTDGGSTWNLQTSSVPAFQNSISFINSTTGFTAGGEGTFSVTTNGGTNWQSLPTPQTDFSYFQCKAVSATEIYLIGDPGFLYKSTDLGSTWTNLPISVSGPSTTFVWYSLDHYGSTYTLSGDYGIIARSTDNCASWSTTNYTQLSTQVYFDITTVPGTSKYWAVGRQFTTGTRQVLYSSNSGANWVAYNTGVNADFNSISMINENTGYISGSSNNVMKTTDGGITWVSKTSPSPVGTSQLYNCEFIDENTGWVFVNFSTVAGGNVFKTTNGGDNWTQYSTGAASENIYSAEMVNANTGFVTMNQSNRPVYKTTNGGVNWTGYSTGLTGSIRSVTSPDGGNTVYVCQTGGTSRVAKSTNGGVNWTLITLPVVADFTSIDFKDANTGYVSGNNTQTIARTTNGGLNWTWQNTHAITNVKVYVTPGDTAWALGGTSAILRFVSQDGDVKVNMGFLMQAMYDQGTNQLVRRDTVKAYLHSAVSPYNAVDSSLSIIDSVTHSGLFTFVNAPSGQYYIVAKHFNSIETWSKSGGEALVADNSTYNYNFTTAASQAFGSNMFLVGSKWTAFTGDVNQDDAVDLSDIVEIFNDATLFVSGAYINTDLNADGFTDLTDLTFAFNNSTNFVGVIRP